MKPYFQTLISFITVLLYTSAGAQNVFPVTKTGDPDPFTYPYNYVDSLCDTTMYGTLQWAIRKANDAPNSSVIQFNIPGSGTHTINLNYTLPILNKPITIDGTSQTGYDYDNGPSIIIDGTNLPYNSHCFNTSGWSERYVIKGLCLRNFYLSWGIIIYGPHSKIINNLFQDVGGLEQGYYRAPGIYVGAPYCIIQGNILGTDITETEDYGTNAENIALQNQWQPADSCVIGGDGLHEANIVANSSATGVAICNGKYNRISRNKIYNNDVAINLTLWAGADWWGNQGKPAPVIDTIAPTGVLSGTSEANDTIEIFGSTGAHNANAYITTAVADTNSNWSAAINNYNWDYLVATATDDSSNTSELSSAFEIAMSCTASAGTDDTICAGQSAQLQANPSYAYAWSSSPADATLTGQTNLRNPVVSPAVTTTYTVTVSNAMGCTQTDAVVVNIYGMLTPGGIGSHQTICYKTVPAPFSGSTPTGGDGVYTYRWQKQTNCTGTWSDISGATAVTYTPDTLTATSCYRRLDFNACDTVTVITLDSGLTGYWPFDGDCKDYSGTGEHGTGTNVTWGTDRTGNANKAAVFNGLAYVSLNNPQNLLADLSKFSISAWIKTTSNSYMRRIVTLHYGATAGSSIALMERNGKFDFYLRSESSYYSTNVYINDGQWHLVALTFDGSAYKAYVDSSLVMTVTSSNYSTLGSYNNNIGTFDGSSYFFNGSLDELRIYNRALSLNDIDALWQAPFLKVSVLPVMNPGSIGNSQTLCKNATPAAFTGTVPAGGTGSYTYCWQEQQECTGSWSDIAGAVCSTYQPNEAVQIICYRRKVISGCDSAFTNTISQGLKARYPFNSDFFDRSGNNYHSINYGALWGTDKDNTSNSAVNFTGTQYVDLNYGSGLNPATTPHTFSFWTKPTTIGISMMAMTAGQAGGTDNRFYMGINGGKWDMGIHTTPWGSGTINATLGWTHIAVAMDGTTATLYVNGNVSRTISYTSYNFNRNIWLANHNSTFWYNGKIDEVQIFDRALSVSEIKSLYSNPDVRLYINQISNPGIIGPTQAVCYHAQPASFTGSLPAGTDSTYLYQWQQQYGCTGNWSDISGATASTYQPEDTLSQTGCFRRLVLSACDTLYASVSDSGLAAYWLFNGDLNDYSGHGFNGTGTNTTFTTGRNDKLYHALNFNGSAYVSLSNPQNMLTDLSEFTISTWIKTTANTAQSRIVTLHYGATAGSSIALMERSGKYDIYLRGESNYYTTGVTINNGQWRHLILSYDGATYKAYVDGSPVFSLASANYSTLGSYNRNIGTYNGSMYNFTGSIDEVRMYNRALTDNEIYSMYHDAIKVTVHPLPTADAGPDTLIFAGDSVQLGAAPISGYTYAWSPGAGLSDSTVAEPWGKPVQNTTYYLMVTDTNVCQNVDSVNISFLGENCESSIQLFPDTLSNSQIFNFSDTIMWFKFIADSSFINIKILDADTLGSEINILSLYSGYCNNLSLIKQVSDTLIIVVNNLTVNSTYYMKVKKQLLNSTKFSICLNGIKEGDIFPVPIFNCLPSVCENKIDNPDFDDLATPPITPGFYSDYSFVISNYSSAPGQIQIGNDAALMNGTYYGWTFWSGTGLGGGNFLACDITNQTVDEIIWGQQISVIPESDYYFSFWVNNIITYNQSVYGSAILPRIYVKFNGYTYYFHYLLSGVSSTSDVLSFNVMPDNWVHICGTWHADPGVTNVSFNIFGVKNSYTSGNDVGIDNIEFRLLNIPIDAGSNMTICKGDYVPLNAIGGDPNGSNTYLWSPSAGLSQTNISNPIASPTVTTTYTVTITTNNCATVTDNVVIKVIQANAGNDASICLGQSTVLNASDGIFYDWSSNPSGFTSSLQSPTVSPIVTTTYTVTVIDNNDCSATDDVVVTVLPLPAPTITITGRPCINSPDLQFHSLTFNSYLWNFGDGSTSTVQNPDKNDHLYTIPGTYQITLTVTDINGCTSCTSHIIQIASDCCAFDQQLNIEYKDNLIPYPFPVVPTTWTPSNNPFNNSSIIRLEHTLTIPAGSHLKLDGGIIIEFGPFGKIIVERGSSNGGILELGKCTLTSISNTFSCNVMWQGIEVWGYSNVPHTSNQAVHGKVIVNGATISNAHNAILLGRSYRYFTNDCNSLSIYKKTPYLLEYSGGIIDANGGSFVNNAISVHFAPYKFNNASSINDCSFLGGSLLDPGYDENNYPEYTYLNNNFSTSPNPLFADANDAGRTDRGIYMWDIRFSPAATPFTDNTFNNMEKGMLSYTSRYTVNECTFTNLNYGIRIFNYNSPVQGHRIFNNSFDQINYYCIQIEGSKQDKVQKNFMGKIYYSQPAKSTGILLNNTSNFNILDNEFNRLWKGIICYNSGSGGGNISAYNNIAVNTGNIFTRCNRSIDTWKDNTKLNIKCNTALNTEINPNEYGGTNWLNPAGSNRLASQGIYSTTNTRKPAGNKFEMESPNRKHITNYASTPITSGSLTIPLIHQYRYNAHSAPTNRIPYKVGYINLNTQSVAYQDSNSCVSCFIPNCWVELVLDNDELTSELQAEYDDVVMNLDSGNTEQLLSAINTNTTDSVLTALLLGSSPLSDEILRALVLREDTTGDSVYTNVIIPNSPVSDTVWSILYQELLPQLDSVKAQQLKNAQAVQNTWRTPALIQIEIGTIETERQWALNNLISNYVDSLQQDSALYLLYADSSINALQTIAGTWLFEGDTAEADTVLAAYIPLTPADSAWFAIMDLLLHFEKTDSTVYDISTSQYRYLSILAENAEPELPTVMAQAILRLVYGEEFELDLDEQSPRLSAPYENIMQSVPGKTNWLLFPNPAKNYAEVVYDLPDTAQGLLCVYNAMGALTESIVLEPGKKHLIIPTQHYKAGIYFFKLFADKKDAGTKKLIIFK